jgi:glucose-6-phosphate-specific signal transduction histidine kinase
MSSKPKPWERQEKETSQAFEAFSLYLGMGAERSITKVVQKLNKSRALIGRWSTERNWQERVKEYENQLATEIVVNQQEEREADYRRQRQIAIRAQMKVVEAIESLDSSKMTASDISTMLRAIKENLDRSWEILSPAQDDEYEDIDAFFDGIIDEYENEKMV